jgi:hypothetical protein
VALAWNVVYFKQGIRTNGKVQRADDVRGILVAKNGKIQGRGYVNLSLINSISLLPELTGLYQ